MAEQKSDVRAAIEWAWMNYDTCIIRNESTNIATAIDFEKAISDPPPGGKQFLDLAMTNKVSFYKEFVMKALGVDIDADDEIIVAEKKSVAELRKVLTQMKE